MAQNVGICPVWIQAQYLDNSGMPLAFGEIWTFVTQYNETVETYTDSTGTVENSNPIILDSSGRLQTGIWLKAGTSYRLVLRDSNGNYLSECNDVAVLALQAGPNITLDPPGGIGPVTISAAGPANINAFGHRATNTFWSINNTPILPNGTHYTNWSTVRKLPVSGTGQDVGMGSNNATFSMAGSYTITVNAVLTPSGGAEWPVGETVYGIIAPTGDYIQQSVHSRFYDGSGGISTVNQASSWTDTFTISATVGQSMAMSVFIQNSNSTTTPSFDMRIETSITCFGEQYTSDWPIPD